MQHSREYEEKVKEVAESMKIGNIVFVSGFDDTKQLVWEARIDDHLHYARPSSTT